jgi:hypothetical protein
MMRKDDMTALSVESQIRYFKNSVRMLDLLWAQLEHHVATGCWVSDTSYKSTIDNLLYDIGQGSCSSPIVLALLNHLLLMTLCKEIDCISRVSIDGKMTDTHPGDSLVDDTTIGATGDIHNREPIPSSASDFTQEEEGLVARIREITQFLLNFIQVTGGNLAPENTHGT